jgi:hypothetical protein
MLHVLGFDRIGVAIADLYFVDPDPEPGQEGAEHGVRLEVRRIERQEQGGSIYASQPILVGQPLWRVDMLETVDGPLGSCDRTHHHPDTQGWEPGRRRFEPDQKAEPIDWLRDQLTRFEDRVGGPDETDGPTRADLEQLTAAAPEIVDIATRMLARVRAGELALAPAGGPGRSARLSWL